MKKTQAAITSHSPNASMRLPFSIGAILTRHGMHGKEPRPSACAHARAHAAPSGAAGSGQDFIVTIVLP